MSDAADKDTAAAPGEGEPEFNPFAPPDAPPPAAADEAPVLEGFDDFPAPEPEPVSPAEADRRAGEERGSFARRPELFVGAAFAGAYAAAKLLRRFGGEG